MLARAENKILKGCLTLEGLLKKVTSEMGCAKNEGHCMYGRYFPFLKESMMKYSTPSFYGDFKCISFKRSTLHFLRGENHQTIPPVHATLFATTTTYAK